MKKLVLLFLFLALAAYGQLLTPVTPYPWSGTTATFVFNITNPLSPTSYYLLSFGSDSMTWLTGNVPAGTCTLAVTHSGNPGQTAVTVIPDSGGIWYSFGATAPLEPGWYSPNTVSNSQCTVHDYTSGSGYQILSDGTLQISLKIDFSASFSGQKILQWTYKYCCNTGFNDFSQGPFWSGPFVENGAAAHWMVGANVVGGSLTGNPGTVITGPNDYAPTASFANTTPGRTDQNTYFIVGDTYQFNIVGPPYAQVVVNRTVNGFDVGTLYFGLDGNGNLAPYGSFGADAIGFWTEQWIINGYATPIISWAVVPASGAPALSFLNTTPGPRYGTTNYAVGETYHFDLAGQPGAVIWKGCVFNDAVCRGPLPPNLAMPSNGHWTFDGSIQPSDAGIQIESWMVGGVPAGPPITLTVLPQ